MTGLTLAREYFETCGRPMLDRDFPGWEKRMAAGLVGAGSECLGYDDEISRDHDFEPGFCLFLPDEDKVDRKTAFALERAYARLPREFAGLSRSLVSPVGGARRGVIRTSDFYRDKVGAPDGALTPGAWLRLPDHALLEATDGEVFSDGEGTFSAIRERLSRYPEDVRLKKLAGHLLLMAQSGQYNYTRCLAHGESGAAQLAMTEFVRATMQVFFLLAGRYMPFYKWSFRALRELPAPLSGCADLLETLLTTDNDETMRAVKADAAEDLASVVIGELQKQSLTEAICGDLEKHAYSVNDRIRDASVRNLHLLAGT